MTALILPGLLLAMVLTTIWAVRRVREEPDQTGREGEDGRTSRPGARPRQRRRLSGR